MLAHHVHDGIVGVLARPVALPFEQHLLPNHRHDAGLHHAIHCVFVRVNRGAAGRVGDHIDVVATLAYRIDREHAIADLRPEAGDNHLLSVVRGERVAHVLIVPRVHRGALDELVIRINRQQLGIGVAREAFGLNRGDGGRHLEHLRRLGEGNHVVLQNLAVDRLNAERHLRLLVDEEELGVLWSEQFKIVRHEMPRTL
jgi:hypothetical protein